MTAFTVSRQLRGIWETDLERDMVRTPARFKRAKLQTTGPDVLVTCDNEGLNSSRPLPPLHVVLREPCSIALRAQTQEGLKCQTAQGPRGKDEESGSLAREAPV